MHTPSRKSELIFCSLNMYASVVMLTQSKFKLVPNFIFWMGELWRSLACISCQLVSGSSELTLLCINFHMATLPLLVPAAIMPFAAEYVTEIIDSVVE